MVIVSVIVSVFFISQPVDVEMSLNEVTPVNNNLPPLKNAQVSLVLDNEKKDTTFLNIGEKITFTNVPHDMIGKEVKVHFSCDDYNTLDTTLILSKNVKLNISRDAKAYGHVHFTLYNQQVQPLANKSIVIDGIETKSDNEGKVELIIQISKQKTIYHITSSSVTLQDTLKDAKCSDSDAVFAK